VPGVKLDHLVTEGHAYRNLLLQVGFGHKADDLALLRNIVTKFKGVKIILV
jgi:hypothetical protein